MNFKDYIRIVKYAVSPEELGRVMKELAPKVVKGPVSEMGGIYKELAKDPYAAFTNMLAERKPILVSTPKPKVPKPKFGLRIGGIKITPQGSGNTMRTMRKFGPERLKSIDIYINQPTAGHGSILAHELQERKAMRRGIKTGETVMMGGHASPEVIMKSELNLFASHPQWREAIKSDPHFRALIKSRFATGEYETIWKAMEELGYPKDIVEKARRFEYKFGPKEQKLIVGKIAEMAKKGEKLPGSIDIEIKKIPKSLRK